MRRTPLCLALLAQLLVLTPAHGTQDPPQSEPPATAAAVESGMLLPALEEYRWTLTTASEDGNRRIDALFPAAGRPYIFAFSASTLTIEGGCNTFGGDYQINAQGQLVAGTLRATMMACAPELMQADSTLTALLAQPLQIELTPDVPPQLHLRTDANVALALQGRATPESLYGPGTLMFLEVDARQLPCRNPRNGQTSCLQVREISFDEQGLRTATPGPWRPFYDSIEGYTHTAGQRNVLRVKRFGQGSAADNAAPAIYVLDLVVETAVETEVVPRQEGDNGPGQ